MESVPPRQPPTAEQETEKKTKNKFRWGNVALGTLTLLAVSWYACEADLQRRATNKTNEITSEAFQVSQGAHVTIGRKDGVIASFISPPKNSTENAQVVIYFHNSGHVPAQLAYGILPGLAFINGQAAGQHSGIIYNHPFKDMARTKNGSIGESTIIAGDSISMAPIGEISVRDLYALPSKNISTLVLGMYHYCDELGTDETRQFSLSYQNAPDADLIFKLVSDEDLPVPHNIEYLSPCKTMSEKKQ